MNHTFTINKLKKIIDKTDLDIPVIVEGKKDRFALDRLGFKKIFDISGKPLHEIADEVKSNNPKSAIILTDFDEEGEVKASHLKKLLAQFKIKTDPFTRERFRSLEIHRIEELNSFIKIMEDDYYGKTCSIYDKIFDRSRVHSRWNYRKT